MSTRQKQALIDQKASPLDILEEADRLLYLSSSSYTRSISRTNVGQEQCETRSINSPKRIDFILVYNRSFKKVENDKKTQYRTAFQQKLMDVGFDVEVQDIIGNDNICTENGSGGSTSFLPSKRRTKKHQKLKNLQYGKRFVKIHAPFELLLELADKTKMKLPIEENRNPSVSKLPFDYFISWLKFSHVDKTIFPPRKQYFLAEYDKTLRYRFEHLFDTIADVRENYFTPAQRSRLVYDFLLRCPFEQENSQESFEEVQINTTEKRLLEIEKIFTGSSMRSGIEVLLRDEVYEDAYPLHAPLIRRIKHYMIPKHILIQSKYTRTRDICDTLANTIMCPRLDRNSYWKLGENCIYAKMAYLFDNKITVCYAAVMTVWSALYLSAWDISEYQLQYEWDTFNLTEDKPLTNEPRPDFKRKVRTTRINPVTGVVELHLPAKERCYKLISSFSIVSMMICLVLSFVFGVVLYRISMKAAIRSTPNEFVKRYSPHIVSITGALINLVVIIALSSLYEKIAIWLTDYEIHRTEKDYENALTLKMFLFQFVNFYASIFYIAFIKPCKRPHEEDYMLEKWSTTTLFYEYLELIIQYGFVTMFLVAFPLAPLCAFLNNIIEIRIDAHKFVNDVRRPVAKKVADIGIWRLIIAAISKLAILTNGLLIALTSDFIPRFVYQYYRSPNKTLTNYVNFSLSIFDTSHYKDESIIHDIQKHNYTYCFYKDHRNPPWHLHPYEINHDYYVIMVARLTFLVTFEHIVFICLKLGEVILPLLSKSVKQQIERKKFIVQKMHWGARLYEKNPELIKRDLKNMYVDTQSNDKNAVVHHLCEQNHQYQTNCHHDVKSNDMELIYNLKIPKINSHTLFIPQRRNIRSHSDPFKVNDDYPSLLPSSTITTTTTTTTTKKTNSREYFPMTKCKTNFKKSNSRYMSLPPEPSALGEENDGARYIKPRTMSELKSDLAIAINKISENIIDLGIS
ncbi:unnamed protein product [Didymodactylos carnosus]|uniref:Anoctamin n=1 Tax=Didymodactylos carnosus TaxID=1234261 RepID=A0A813VBV8_9BILA|nr:unnamed protein product [Didymodactylos carnosus]CAF3625920.1 unnamed protein product [Didymodactylos carnosus]